MPLAPTCGCLLQTRPMREAVREEAAAGLVESNPVAVLPVLSCTWDEARLRRMRSQAALQRLVCHGVQADWSLISRSHALSYGAVRIFKLFAN